MKKRVYLKITGRVQGVWYRASTKKIADKLNVYGTVKNDLDGGVSVVAEGEEEALKKFINWCYEGPPAAKVNNIDIKWDNFTGEFNSFEILY